MDVVEIQSQKTITEDFSLMGVKTMNILVVSCLTSNKEKYYIWQEKEIYNRAIDKNINYVELPQKECIFDSR